LSGGKRLGKQGYASNISACRRAPIQNCYLNLIEVDFGCRAPREALGLCRCAHPAAVPDCDGGIAQWRYGPATSWRMIRLVRNAPGRFMHGAGMNPCMKPERNAQICSGGNTRPRSNFNKKWRRQMKKFLIHKRVATGAVLGTVATALSACGGGEGVWAWSKPGVGQQPQAGTWLRFDGQGGFSSIQ
jgi:hypothetical protein